MSTTNRKDFLKKMTLGTLTGAALLGTTNAKGASYSPNQSFRWKMITAFPPKFPPAQLFMDEFTRSIVEMSDGSLKIQVFAGGEIFPSLDTFDKVSDNTDNTVQLGAGMLHYWASKQSALNFFGSVPLGMNAQQVNAWLLAGGGMKLVEEALAPFKLVPILVGNTGAQTSWFNKEINGIDDFKGIKMNVWGLGSKVLERMGGTPKGLPIGEVFTSLERGVIDATEELSPISDLWIGFYQAAKFCYLSSWQSAGTPIFLFVHKPSYDGLPNHLKAILKVAAERINMRMLASSEYQNPDALETLKTQYKVEMRQFSAQVLTDLRKVTDEVIAEEIAANPLSKKVYESYNAFQKKIAPWAEASEKAFYNRK